MRLGKSTPIETLALGEAIRIFITESEKASPAKWPEVAKNLAAASFMAGAEYGAKHPDPKALVRQCNLGKQLFDKMSE